MQGRTQKFPDMIKFFSKINAQQVTAASAVFISFCALFISLYQAMIMGQQQEIMNRQYEASLWPSLEVLMNTGSDSQFSILLKNKGTGPAIIEAMEVTVEGRPAKNWYHAFQQLAGVTESVKVNFGKSLVVGRVMSADEEISLLNTVDSTLVNLLNRNYGRLTIRLCYRSIYEKHWLHTRAHENNSALLSNKETEGCVIRQERAFSR